MKKDMPLEGLRWSRDSGSALYDTPQDGRSRTGWGGTIAPLIAPKRFGYVKLGIKRDREKAPLSLLMSVTSESLTQSAHNNML